MNLPTTNRLDSHAGSPAGGAEETLRLVAGVAAPEGLEDRVKAALRQAPRTARILPWPSAKGSRWMQNQWARSAAAAAIVFVVAGGGWRVYKQAQPAPAPKVIAMPRVIAPGGFATGGAMRTPQTLVGPTVTHKKPAATKTKPSTAKKTPANSSAGSKQNP
jgi:hypothetical protein